MRLDEARGLVMQALRETGWNQVSTLVTTAGILKARSQGINPNLHPSYQGGRQFLERGDETILIEVIWSLIVQGILVPGIDDSNQAGLFFGSPNMEGNASRKNDSFPMIRTAICENFRKPCRTLTKPFLNILRSLCNATSTTSIEPQLSCLGLRANRRFYC
jgi:hypothetical protein